MSKRILSMLLAIVMVVGMMHGMSITANAATSGNCGTNATYTLDDNGLLVISCTNPSETGAIRADAFEGNTNIREIVIEEGITQISNDAFYKCNNLEKVTIKGNLTSLGYRAFGVSSQSSSRNKLVTVEYYGTNPVYTFGQYSDPFANRNAVTVSVLTTYSGQWFANKRITEANKTLMVTKKLSADNVTLTPASGVYNGSEQKPTVVVKDGSKTLVAGTDYTITWAEGFKDAGDYAVTVKGKGNYEDEVTKTYTISPKKLTADNVTLTPASGDYNGTEQKPTVVVKDGSKTLVAGTDYTITWAEGFKDAGDYAVTVKGKGNYDVETSVVKYYKINQVTASVTITPKTLEYTGAAQELITVENVAGGEISYKLGDGEWSTAIPKATNAGTYKVYYKIAADKNHKDLEGSTQVTINPKALTEANVTISAGVTYNGTKQEPTIKVPGLALGTDYTVTFERNDEVTTDFTNAGTITVIVAGKGNYAGSVKKTYTIAQADRGTLTLKAPVSAAMPGNVIILTVEGNTAEADAIQIAGEGVKQVDGLKVKIGEDVALGGKVTIKVVYAKTTNYLAAETNTIELKVGMTDYSNEIAALEKKIAELEAKLDDEVDAALQKAIDDLKKEIKDLKDADKKTAEDISDLNDKIEGLKDIYATKVELAEAVGNLNAAIANKADKATVDAAIATLQREIAALEAAKDKYIAADTALKTELKGEIDAARALIAGLAERVDGAEAAIDALKEEIKDLKAADATNAADLQKAITDLNAAIEAAKDAAKDAATAADNALKQELNGAIDDAKDALEDKIAQVQKNLDDAVITLNAAIDTKADKATVDAAIANLQNAIDALEAAKDNYVAADAALKAELEAAIKAATDRITTLENQIGNVQNDLDTTKAKLDKAIEDLNKAIADGEELSDEIDALAEALEAAKEALENADDTNKEYLEGKIADAQTSLENAIKAVQENLDQAIEDLKEADADNAANLEKAINRLNKAIEDAKAAAKDADARLERKLNKKIEDADKALHKKIDAVQQNLNKAKEDLAKAIAAGDKNLHDRITRLNDAMNAADTALKAADEALKKQLETEIKAANDLIDSLEFRMDTAEDAIAVLDKAVEELKKVDAANAAAMKAAIENLNKAIKGVKEFAEKSDAETKAALNEKINAAQTALEAKIAEIQANLDKAVEELKAADQANAEKLADAIARLKEAIEVAEAASAAADAVQDEHIIALKNEINRVAIDLEKAQANLEAALKAEIEALTSELKRAEEALKNAIDTKADEDAVNAAIAELQNEIAALEAAKNNYIAADAALKAEVEAAIAKAKQEAIEAAKGHIPYIGENGNWWIGNSDTGVDANGIQGETGKDGITPKLRVGSGNIWEVSYDNGKTWTSLGVSAVGASGSNGRNGRDGKDGVDGKDGITPQLRINEDTNMWEISYDEGKTWESLGVVATGADGADGANGADGITPQLRINEKTNMWEVSYDEGATWTSMGVKATGADGSSNILALVISGISLAGMIAMLCIMLVDRKKRGLPVG